MIAVTDIVMLVIKRYDIRSIDCDMNACNLIISIVKTIFLIHAIT